MPKDNQKTVTETLYSKFGIAASSPAGYGLCPHVCNTREHVIRAINAPGSMRDLIKV